MTGAVPRVGVIGCGFFAENHLGAWHYLPGVTLNAVFDIDEEKARGAAERYAVPHVFTSAEALMD